MCKTQTQTRNGRTSLSIWHKCYSCAILHCLISATVVTGIAPICSNTGCQLDAWATTGCEIYGRVESMQRPCVDFKNRTGAIYTCCIKMAEPCAQATDKLNTLGITFGEFTTAATSNQFPAPSCAQFESFILGLPKGNISTKQEAVMALANFIHESAGLTAKREFGCLLSAGGCPGAYQTPGCDAPGQRYFGRGYIQLSWCYNYRPASLDLFGDERLVRDPDLVAKDEQTAWDTAFWFWKVNVHSAKGVQDGKFGATVRAINGALECDGLYQEVARERYAIYVKTRAAFGLAGLGNETGCYN